MGAGNAGEGEHRRGEGRPTGAEEPEHAAGGDTREEDQELGHLPSNRTVDQKSKTGCCIHP
jgi:hypothetical protein